MVELFAIKLTDNKYFEARKELMLSFLPESARVSVLRHKTASGFQSTLLGELLSRKIISRRISIPTREIEFRKTLKGKPFLENHPILFNISHSGDWVVLAVAETDVGIDIEKIRPVNYRVAKRFFSSRENSLLETLEGTEKLNLFFDYWTLKESYLKLLGTGLTKSLSSFTVVRNNDKFVLKENIHNKREPVFFKQYNLAENYKLSVCAYENDFVKEPEILTLEELKDDC